MHSQRVGVPQGSPSDKWLSAKRRKWIPFKPALTIDVAKYLPIRRMVGRGGGNRG